MHFVPQCSQREWVMKNLLREIEDLSPKKGPMEVGSIQNEALRAMMMNRLKSNFHDKLGPVGNEACLAGSEATAEAISESSPKEEPR